MESKELNEAIDYYNGCQDNLGIEFASEVYTAIQLILQFPKAWSPLSKNTRRCLTNRFPYGIIYQEEKTEYFPMRSKKYCQGNAGYLKGRAEMLKARIYTMPLVRQREDVIFQYFLLRNLKTRF